MSDRVRTTMLLVCLLGAFGASRASAGIPDPANSEIPCGFNLVGTNRGVADAHGEFKIVVRDLAHDPIAGSSVVIDFSACSTDIRVCSIQPVAGISADCLTAVGNISAVTDGAGSVVLRIVGGARNTAAHTPGAGYRCATVFADGVNLGTVNIGAFDEDGVGGVNAADVSTWLEDAFDFPAVYVGRSDFDCSHTIDPVDLAMMLQVDLALANGSIVSCPAYCH